MGVGCIILQMTGREVVRLLGLDGGIVRCALTSLRMRRERKVRRIWLRRRIRGGDAGWSILCLGGRGRGNCSGRLYGVGRRRGYRRLLLWGGNWRGSRR